MSGRTVRTAAIRMAGGILFAFLLLPVSPQPAAACDVSYQYQPKIDFGNLGSRHTCATSTSLAGSVVVFALALTALAAVGVMAIRRESRAMELDGSTETALSDYLAAAGGGADGGPTRPHRSPSVDIQDEDAERSEPAG